MVVVLEVENSGGEAGALVEAMVERRYRPVVFDGLNRFFVAEEHAELEPRLLAPANVNDRFVWYAHLDRVAALQGEIAALRGQLRSAGGAPGTPAAAAEAPSPRPRPLDRVAAALAPHRRWLAPAGSRREALARRVLSGRERRP
jgi:hypothetical protein